MLGYVGQQLGVVVESMMGRLSSDASYRDGFLVGFLVAGTLAVLLSVINYSWARIQKFFSATKAPATPSAGPTPVGIAGGCAVGAIILLALAVIGLGLVSGLANR
jgi:hypothetical protein